MNIEQADIYSAQLLNVLIIPCGMTIKRTFQHIATSKNLAFEVAAGQGISQILITDGKRLQQVLMNLLSNSFKFTEKGKITLIISIVTKGWDRDNATLNAAEQVLAFEVRDIGLGIPKDKQKLIFEAFRQADGSTSRKYGGTGLGLLISREIGRLPGGEITLFSEPGKGSIFTLYLPQYAEDGVMNGPYPPKLPKITPEPGMPARSSSPLAIPGRLTDKRPSLAGQVAPAREIDDRQRIGEGDRVVLIVEDDKDFAKLLLEMVNNHDFKGVISYNGIDVGLFDIMMTGMDGYTLIREIRKTPHFKKLPAIAVPAKAMKKDRANCIEAGASDHITKPVDMSQLLSLLRVWLYRSDQIK